MKLLNALSLNMYDGGKLVPVTNRIDIERIKDVYSEMQFESCIGHQTTAEILSSMLGRDIPCNRCTVDLKEGEKAIIAQYKGPRLPEGATKLPEGAEIVCYLVEMITQKNAFCYKYITKSIYEK